MGAQGYTLFDTAIGCCGIAWEAAHVVGVQLPEGSAHATRRRMLERFPGAGETAAPARVRHAIGGMTGLLRGERADLGRVALALDRVPPFHRRVYVAARDIPPGHTVSYGELAARIGAPGAARAVGQALGRNPFPIIVPCHRVLAANGKPGGFTATGGAATKLRMLAIEGAMPAARATDDAGPGFDLREATAHLRACDARLGRLIERIGPCRLELKPTASLFAALAEAIVYQQLHGKAAATIFGRVCALFPRAQLTPARLLSLPEDALRAAGLSRNKLLALQDLARRSVAREIPTVAALAAMADDEIVERLCTVRGIGRWTVEMLLMFRLGRPDVLPVDDFGIRKGFAVAWGKREMPAPRELARYGERWAPYRTVASWYLWRAAEQAPPAR
jgi:methylated-DNA-[protein]-cysteine S-methyltransferase